MKNCCGHLRISSLTDTALGRWLSLWVVCGLLLGGCAGQPSPSQPQPQPQSTRTPSPQEQRRLDRQWRIMELLRDAERALHRDRLMQPEYDNAYDRFNAVLKLQPDNAQAQQGLQAIVVRYVQLGREALAASRLSSARTYAARAAAVDPDNPLLQEFEQSLGEAAANASRRRTIAPPEAAAEASSLGTEYPLPVSALNQRDERVRGLLADIAQRVMLSDETVLIIARNDAEGRWLYKQMKEAAAGYRIRGDIQIGPVPKIVLYPPLQ